MKIDIVIPTLNSASVLDDCLTSIKNHISYNAIIVVDGGSTDKTIDICKKYGCKIYVCKKSLGDSRMLGISKAETDWLLFIDSDIVVDALFFRELKKYIKEDVGAIQGDAVLPENYYNYDGRKKPKELDKKERGYTNCTLIRSRLVKSINLRGINAYEDWLLKNHILDKGYKWLSVSVPVKHFEDYKGHVDRGLKARWNGAGLRKSKVTSHIYIIKWFFGITFKSPVEKKPTYGNYIGNLKYFFNTLIGYLFYREYDKIER